MYNKEVLKEIEKTVNTKFKIISEKDTLEKVSDLGYVIPRRYNQIYNRFGIDRQAGQSIFVP